jgi:hypothetical protein
MHSSNTSVHTLPYFYAIMLQAVARGRAGRVCVSNLKQEQERAMQEAAEQEVCKVHILEVAAH